MTASPLFESRLPVGSSASRMTGSPATARATATRCCCPPESWLGTCFARCAMPTRSRASVTRCRRSAGPHAAVGEGQLDVLEDREIADQIEALEDEADLAIADARRVRGLELGDRPAVELVRPLRGGVEEAQDREQRRLAAPRGPADRDVFAARDLDADVRQRVRFDVLGGEDLGEILQFDDGRWSGVILISGPPIEDERDRRRPTPTCPTTRPDRRRSGPRGFPRH